MKIFQRIKDALKHESRVEITNEQNDIISFIITRGPDNKSMISRSVNAHLIKKFSIDNDTKQCILEFYPINEDNLFKEGLN